MKKSARMLAMLGVLGMFLSGGVDASSACSVEGEVRAISSEFQGCRKGRWEKIPDKLLRSETSTEACMGARLGANTALISCSSLDYVVFDGTTEEACRVEEREEGVALTCADGSEATLRHGERGEEGPQGQPGEEGPKGATGPEGPQGPRGKEGEPGEKGETGEPGPRGPMGDLGPQGEPGPQGDAGIDGIPGSAGPAGAQGPEGAPGDAGPVGAPGEQGARGESGPHCQCIDRF